MSGTQNRRKCPIICEGSFDKTNQKHPLSIVETEILFCNIKNVAHKRATFGLIGAIYGGRYEKCRPAVNNPIPFLDCVSGRQM